MVHSKRRKYILTDGIWGRGRGGGDGNKILIYKCLNRVPLAFTFNKASGRFEFSERRGVGGSAEIWEAGCPEQCLWGSHPKMLGIFQA